MYLKKIPFSIGCHLFFFLFAFSPPLFLSTRQVRSPGPSIRLFKLAKILFSLYEFHLFFCFSLIKREYDKEKKGEKPYRTPGYKGAVTQTKKTGKRPPSRLSRLRLFLFPFSLLIPGKTHKQGKPFGNGERQPDPRSLPASGHQARQGDNEHQPPQ